MRNNNSSRLKKHIENNKYEHKVWSYMKATAEQIVDTEKNVAFIDCTREYTYAETFKEWERYARAFSGLKICQSNKSRVALAGMVTAEPAFCYFGLNMTGAEVSMFSYPDFLPTGQWKTMIQKERITDLIISDFMVTPELWKEIQNEKEKLGLRNVILMHSKVGGPCAGPGELIYNEFNYHKLRRTPGVVFLDDLIEKYKNTTIDYGKSSDGNIGVIAHTSGTTHGTRKPIVYTEADIINGSQVDSKKHADSRRVGERKIVALDLSSLQTLIVAVNSAFTQGCTSVFTFFGFLHPKFIRTIDYYKPTSCFVSGFVFDKWLERTDLDDIDLSSLNSFRLAGSYVPNSSYEKYKEFLKKRGSNGKLLRLYGMSEVMGNPIINASDEDIMGIPEHKELVRIQDECDKKFYKISDGPRTGILHMSGPSVCRNTLDGVKLFDYAVIDGRNYICTNDLVRVEKNGDLVFCGRADKYFVNNEGKRFDSGIVESELSKQTAIGRCAIAPVLEKRIHDTVPVLYVIPEKGKNYKDIRDALLDIYVKKKKIKADNIPVQLMIVNDIPLNQNGKIDIFRITRERLQGDAYDIIPVRNKEKLTDIQLKHVDKLSSIVAAVPEGMNNGSAFSLFELLN